MSDSRTITSDMVLSLGYDFSMRPDEAISARAVALSGALPSNAFAPVGIKDDIPQRAICLAQALRFYDIESVLTHMPGPWKAKAEETGLKVDAEHPVNIELYQEGGTVYVGIERELFVAQHGADFGVWDGQLAVFGDKPKPNDTWRHGSHDPSMNLADRVSQVLRHTAGAMVAEAVRLGTVKTLPHSIVFRKSDDAKQLPGEAAIWAGRLAGTGYNVTADKRMAERLSIGRESGGEDAEVTWNRHGQVLCKTDRESYAISYSGSLAAAARACLLRKPVVFGVPRVAIKPNQGVDAVLSGLATEQVAAALAKRGVSVAVVEPDSKTIPDARCFVACDDTQATADLALSALMSGVIPIVPASTHTALWAIPNIVSKVANNDPLELAEMTAELCAVKSKVFDAWRLRGVDGWGRLFSIGRLTC